MHLEQFLILVEPCPSKKDQSHVYIELPASLSSHFKSKEQMRYSCVCSYNLLHIENVDWEMPVKQAVGIQPSLAQC